ncbi:MAG: hypothetical protein A3A65_01130 [Candidatus Chisholmbacteria bacterium RIFCSPLOWO2_01_FULL_49_14]|uniref:Uncharacterized protein n=1 Tax=Candidatus Chisholmbacteria bacterium RIFCSPLOWO2_01_FULL_49_14 TaxID=1797593 RepID=A0A1G1VZC7_9BACT|nr:MAG: hypothetical protein A3A65_01130 [Candidatus Chisholmbacteria bacterium RIFCSPLOWO2_01_FULL_49_14]
MIKSIDDEPQLDWKMDNRPIMTNEVDNGRDDFADVSTGSLSRKYERYASMLKTGIPSSDEMLLTWEYLEEIGDLMSIDILRQKYLNWY